MISDPFRVYTDVRPWLCVNQIPYYKNSEIEKLITIKKEIEENNTFWNKIELKVNVDYIGQHSSTLIKF